MTKKEMVGYDMRAVGVCVGDVENRDKRMIRAKLADPK